MSTSHRYSQGGYAADRRARRSLRAQSAGVVLVASLVVHAALILWLRESDLSSMMAAMVEDAALPPGELDLTAATEPAPLPPPSCEAEVMLAAGAQALWCATPFADTDSVGACLDETLIAMRNGRDVCSAVPLGESMTVALMEEMTPEEVDEIEAEPLLELDPEALEELRKQLEQQQPKPPPPQPAIAMPKPPEPKRRPDDQFVEVAKPDEEKAPVETRFLSEFDSSVEKQTVARGSKFEEMIAKPKDETLTPTAKPRESSVPELKPDQPVGRSDEAPELPGMLSMRNPGSSEMPDAAERPSMAGALDGTRIPAMDGGFAPRRGDGSISTQGHDPVETPNGEGGAGGGAPMVPNLRPSEEILERALGGGSVDHLEDVETGDETSINSKRSLHAVFFNRMKRQVAQNWDPASIHARRDPTGRVYGTKTRITKVRVSLDRGGKVDKIYIIEASGVDFLDDEAVRAFRAASPFPNLPEELAGDPFTFGFYFEIGESPKWKIFKAN